MAAAVLEPYVRYGTTRPPTGGCWKRPAARERLRRDRPLALRPERHVADPLRARRA
jgi:hypothetical protein